MLASRLAWLRTTPFGSPVLPDVYWMSAVDVSCVIGSRARGRARRKLGDALDRGQASHLRLQQGRDASPFRNRYQHTRAGVAQDARLTAQVLLQLRQPHRRIDRDRHCASIENGEKRNEEVAARRQHQGDAIAGHDIPLDQALRGFARGLGQLAIGHGCGWRDVILEHSQVQAVRMPGYMPFQDFYQGPRFGGSRHKGERRCRGYPPGPHARDAPVPAPGADRRQSPPRLRSHPQAARGRPARSSE